MDRKTTVLLAINALCHSRVAWRWFLWLRGAAFLRDES
jgi:hypothetical protein